jgi:hypothetical protein
MFTVRAGVKSTGVPNLPRRWDRSLTVERHEPQMLGIVHVEAFLAGANPA